jgi:hypothetical protein
VALVRTDVSEIRIAPIIRVTRIGELGITLTLISKGTTPRKTSSQRASVDSYFQRCSKLADSCQVDDGGDTFLRNVGSYKSHTA